MTLIDVKHLSVRYGEQDALRDVSVAINRGDFVGVVGPNGSGKTTLVKTLLRLVAPQAGAVTIDGTALTAFRAWHLIGYLPQQATSLVPRFPGSAREVVASGLLAARPFPKRMRTCDHDRVTAVMDQLGIAALAPRPIGLLSGGEQQRVLLARALVHRPAILILDEPTVALDPHARELFYSILKGLAITILLVSHDTGAIGHYASKLLYLDRTVIFYGTFDEFCRSAKMTDYFGGATQHLMCHRHT